MQPFTFGRLQIACRNLLAEVYLKSVGDELEIHAQVQVLHSGQEFLHYLSELLAAQMLQNQRCVLL